MKMNNEHFEPPPGTLALLDAAKVYFPELWERRANAVATEKTIVRPERPSFINEHSSDYRPRMAIYNQKSRSLPRPDEANSIFAGIQQAMKYKLQAGEVIAWARKNSPVDPWIKVPTSAWQFLQISLTKGTAKNANVQLFNIHVSNVHADLSVSDERILAGPKGVDLVPLDEPPVYVRELPLPEKGKAGRPTNMPIILAELERRIEECSIEGSLKRQAAALCKWYELNHPHDDEPIGEKAIQNKAGKLYNAGKAKCANKLKG
jgi:hypothetical protein